MPRPAMNGHEPRGPREWRVILMRSTGDKSRRKGSARQSSGRTGSTIRSKPCCIGETRSRGCAFFAAVEKALSTITHVPVEVGGAGPAASLVGAIAPAAIWRISDEFKKRKVMGHGRYCPSYPRAEGPTCLVD